MASPPTRRVPPSTVRPAVVYVLAFAAVGAWVPYSSVFLRSLGLDLGAIGVLIGVAAAVGIVAAPSWGSIADRLGDVRPPLLVAALLAGALATALALTRAPLLVALEVPMLAVGTAGITPMVDARTVELLGDDRDRYGRARAWGSAAFIASAVGVGAVIDRVGPPGLFLVYAPALVLTGVAGGALLGRSQRRHTAAPRPGMGVVLRLLRRPSLGLFFVGSILVWASSSAVLTFFSLRLVDLGADASLVGIAWAANALVEVPLMFAFPSLARSVPTERLLVIGAFAFALRAAGWAATGSASAFVAVAGVGGVGFALFFVGTVAHVAATAPATVRATAQGLFSGTAYGIGSITGAVLGGTLAQALGLPALFALAALGSTLAAGVVGWAVLRAPRAGNSAPEAGARSDSPAHSSFDRD